MEKLRSAKTVADPVYNALIIQPNPNQNQPGFLP